MVVQSEKYSEFGQMIITDMFPELNDVSVAWIASDKGKKTKDRVTLADCTKVSERYSWCCPYDFMITVYEPNVDGMTDEQIKILLEHEIRHIGIDDNGNMYVKSHDIEEFRDIINRFGIDWSRKNDIDYALLD